MSDHADRSRARMRDREKRRGSETGRDGHALTESGTVTECPSRQRRRRAAVAVQHVLDVVTNDFSLDRSRSVQHLTATNDPTPSWERCSSTAVKTPYRQDRRNTRSKGRSGTHPRNSPPPPSSSSSSSCLVFISTKSV